MPIDHHGIGQEGGQPADESLLGEAAGTREEGEESRIGTVTTGPRRRLLLIHDGSSQPLCFPLTGAGFEVEAVTSAAEALTLLSDRRYTLIVADCRLPDLPPLDWMAALLGAAPATPLVLGCEADAAADLRVQSRDFGAVMVFDASAAAGDFMELVKASLQPAADRPG